MAIRDVNVRSWEEFEEELRALRSPANRKDTDGLPLLYRGQENSQIIIPDHTRKMLEKQLGHRHSIPVF